MIYSLIMTAKLNRVDPQASLTHLHASIAEHPAARLAGLVTWNCSHRPNLRGISA